MYYKNYSSFIAITILLVSLLLSVPVTFAQNQVTLSVQGVGEKITGPLPVTSGY